METYISDLEAIRKHFGFLKVSILGHSWGGFLAMKYAIAYPKSVDKLIVSNASPASSEEFAIYRKEFNRRMSFQQEELEKIQNSKDFLEGKPSVIENFYRMIFREVCYHAKSADLLNLRMTSDAAIKGLNVRKTLHESEFSKPFSLYPSLRELKVQTLIIHGDTDSIPSSSAESLHRNIPNSKYILMKNCGHFPFVEDPQGYFQSIRSFLSDN